MRVLTDPVGPGLVAFCGPESGDRFAADPEKHIRRYGKVLALWLRRPQASRCFHSGKLILSFHRVPDNDHRGGGETRGGSSPPFGTIAILKGISASRRSPFFQKKWADWLIYGSWVWPAPLIGKP
jgi:hypothetical protein